MATVSNRFFVTAIKDGQIASGYLRCNTTLQQFYDKSTKACAPDWRPGHDTQPVITAYTRLGGADKAPQTNDWYWNGSKLSFDAQGKSTQTYTMNGTTYPLFIKGTDASGRPTLTVNGNLAGYGTPAGEDPVIDQDIITNKGVIEASGAPLDYAIDIVVRLSYLVATNGYWGSISFDGNSVITNPDPTTAEGQVKLDCALYLGTQAQAAADFNVKWYIEGDPTVRSQQKSYTLTANDVTDNVTVRCDYYDKASTPNLLCSAYIEVDDAQDDDEMQITHPGGKSSANLRKSDTSVTFTMWMSSKTNPAQVKSGYNRYRVKILNSSSSVITNQIAPSGASIVDGYWDITKASGIIIDGSPVTGICGQITIPFDVVAAPANGDAISGVVIADYYTNP